ncbi:serine hydrolase domain-containing protein [Rhizobium herbae]|uniref:CubicO group peptidase (Beta-lactamase class C family) n=1 Tax=Rhizobium herbae TaxID=508661 RepID=A0ABS4EK68_9HYPH|nr:serine hydrolase domain-containing protein [Rhizobium herbae]MBP1858349.1 CubicO group peptidase (beta-lactamase class C family) [Rhizobium herbae]
MSVERRLDRVIDRFLDSGRVTGAVVLAYQHGEPIFRRAAGFADREAGMPVKFDTIFRLASVTKPIVAATALAMIDRGLMALSDRVADHLPWFRPKTKDGKVADITIHQLLTHTSGLVYDLALELLPADRAITCGLLNTDLDYAGNFSRHNAVQLAFAPGTQWAYSFATDILGAVIANVQGASLEEAVVTYIAGPLGMADSRFHVTDVARLAVPYADSHPVPVRMTDPYFAAEDTGWTMGFSPSRIFNPKAFQSGGAGMAGTADDILIFLEALRVGGKGVLTPETIQAGFSNRIGELVTDPGCKFGYFGAVVEDSHAAMTPQSPGTIRWGGVYGHNWFIDPARGLTVLNMTNNAVEGCMGEFPNRIVEAVYGV